MTTEYAGCVCTATDDSTWRDVWVQATEAERAEHVATTQARGSRLFTADDTSDLPLVSVS